MRIVLLFVGILFISNTARAVELIGNLPSDDGGEVQIGNPGGSLQQVAVSFTMPADNYNLDNLILRLGNALTGGLPRVSLHANDGGGDPGTEIVVFNNPALTDVVDNFTFIPMAATVLQAGKTYWVLVDHADNGNDFDWKRSDPDVDPFGIAQFGTSRFSANDGTAYADTASYSFSLNGTLVQKVPTLSQWGLLILGLMMLCIGVLATKQLKRVAI